MLSVDERKVPVSTWVLPTRVPTETWEQPGLQGPMACGAPAGDGDAARGASRPCGLRVSEEKPLCADRPEGRRPRSGEELAAPLGGGASSREVSPALQPGSGAPRAGPDPLPLGSGLRSSSPDAPAPPRAGGQGPGPGTLHPPGSGRGRPAPQPPGRPRGPRPGPPSTPSGWCGRAASLRVVVCVCTRERGPAGPTGFPPWPLGRRAGKQGRRGSAPEAGALDPGAHPAPPPPRPSRLLRGAQAARLRLRLCARPERPLPPAANPWATRRPSAPGRRSPGRGLCGTVRWEASPPDGGPARPAPGPRTP